MPTYEYVCRSCGEQLEVVQSFTDDALETCTACGGSLRKVFGNVGIVFKGSGFYKTDSRQTSSVRSGSSPEPTTGGGGAAGSDGPSGNGDKAPSGGSESDSKTASKPAEPSTPATSSPSSGTATSTKPVPAAS